MTTPSAQPMHIIVGIELDETGEVAFRHAARLARDSDAELHLCFAVGPVDEGATEAERRLEHGEQALARWATPRVVGHPLIERTHLYVDLGEPADVLRRLAADVGASMIVVGSHGKGPLSRLTKGSVVHELMAASPCPVSVATEMDHDRFRSDAALEPAPPANQAPRTLDADPHRYSYRRSIRLSTGQPTVGAGGIPMAP